MTLDKIKYDRLPLLLNGEKDDNRFSIARIQMQTFPSELVAQRQEGYSIFLLIKGKLTTFIDFEKHEVVAPAIISLAPGQIHRYEEVRDVQMVRVSFSSDFLTLEFQGWIACWECMFGHVVMKIAETELAELLGLTDVMLRESDSNREKKDMILRNILQAYIISVARLRRSPVRVVQMDNQQHKIVHQFKTHVDDYFREKAQVSQYAELLFITPGHLNDVIRATVGKTAKQVIDERRVAEAKRLLFYGNHSIKEISGILNFDDDAYFNRYFKKHTGLTPLVFQRTIREKYS
jgi:AraC-like DNA-binding protein